MQNKPQYQKAQAMVEFALVLPILLLIIVGILEVGRAIFMYSSIITASREGSRYGSAAGDNLNGDPLYRDCAGIRNAVRKAGMLLDLRDENIIIQYDRDTNTDPGVYVPAIFDTCDGGYDGNIHVAAGDRIRVTVTAPYNPMIPLFVPLTSRELESVSVRTINTIISIHAP